MRVFKNKVLKSLKGKGGDKDDADVNYSLKVQPDGNVLRSTDFLSSLDLLCEGEIEGFVNPDGALVKNIDILQAVYLNDVPVLEVDSYSSVKVKSIPDRTAPKIIILGDNPQTINLSEGESFVDAGASSDGGETVSAVSTVDDQTLGSYTVTYSATDAAGNTGTAIRVVNVVEKQAPVITIIGSNPITVEKGSVYSDAGATADGGETITTINNVDTNVLTTYQVIYFATNSSGNTGSAIRIVHITDTVSPVITIQGDNPLQIPRYSTYTEHGATSDGGEFVSISYPSSNSNGTVDTSTEGTYTVTYSATDAAGNTGTATRTVEVIDEIGLLGWGTDFNSSNAAYDSQENEWTWTVGGNNFTLYKKASNQWEIKKQGALYRTSSSYSSDVPLNIPWADWARVTIQGNDPNFHNGLVIKSSQYPKSSYLLQGFSISSLNIDGTYSFNTSGGEMEWLHSGGSVRMVLRMQRTFSNGNTTFDSPLGYEWEIRAVNQNSVYFWSDRLDPVNDQDKILDPTIGGFTNSATFGTNVVIGTIS